MLITKSHAQKILISDKEEHLFLELSFFRELLYYSILMNQK